ncbi:MAG: HAMP domain-containing sensor histidine kinase [Polyangiaceae bacterium]|jgi:signal transduction histidine kinase
MGEIHTPKKTRGGGEFDSEFDLPQCVAVDADQPSMRLGEVADDNSHVRLGEFNIISLAISSPELRNQVKAALSHLEVVVAGPEVVRHASLIVADSRNDVAHQLAELRRTARPDAAIFVVLPASTPEMIASAHAAGASACLRPPFVIEEVRSLVLSALDSRAARVQAADLARKLDLESHLASIGRISAGLSHEVSTPLAAAALNLEIIERETAGLIDLLKWLTTSPLAEVEHRLETARQRLTSVETANGLVGAIQDTMTAHERLRALLATLRAFVGRSYEVRRESLDVRELAHDVLAWLSEVLRDVQVELVGDATFAQTDRTLLAQVLTNLVSNAAHAAKSLSAPKIRLHVYQKAGHVVVSVRDNGPGIPIELQDKVFEPFFTTRRSEGGTGLGLALCREYALQMNAELSLWSLPGRGACFRIALPAAHVGIGSRSGA